MDQEVFRKLAKFTLLARRELGLSVDVARLANDPAYASQTLAAGESSESEDLIVLALSLREALGLLAPATPDRVPASSEASAPAVPPGKYRFGARG
jgi:hypothetical protein